MTPPCAPGEMAQKHHATLDHTQPKGTTHGQLRPARAAHAYCNSARHHDPTIKQKHMDKAAKLFGDKSIGTCWRLCEGCGKPYQSIERRMFCPACKPEDYSKKESDE